MADSNDLGLPALQKLQSAEQMELLDVVDSLRACGLSEIVALPQLIVCGDQSSGKSSVLEAISGIPFPRQETLCTRFATEVILRRASRDEIKVSIVPATDRTQVDQERLKQFHRELKTKDDFGDLFKIAGSEMGLSSSGRSFSNDILRVEFCGPSQPQLTLVDLPGLIHAQIESQTTGDVELVHSLVTRYLESPRSIILAVVSAKNDIGNQIILRKARDVDPQGRRTLGIITKPDLLVKGSKSEESFIALARNEVVKFSLGWHVVKNIDSAIAQSQQRTRDEQESLFFQESNFNRLPAHKIGIKFLRARLSKELFSQIRKELPRLVEDIQVHISAAKIDRDKLGPSRKEKEQQRSFLISLSQSFHSICRDAVRGDYDHEFFQSDSSPERRLCAIVMNMHFDFASNIRKNGASWLVDDENSTSVKYRTREEAIKEACTLLKRSRGRELPGLPNPLLVGELFRQYSLPWGDLARMHIKNVWETTNRFLELLLRHLTDADVSDNVFRFWLHPIMEEKLNLAYSKLDELLEVHKDYPMTTNIQFINDSRKPWQDASKPNLASMLKNSLGNSGQNVNIDELTLMLSTMSAKSDLDMDMVAAEVAFDNMNAYYEVALNLFTDNVPTLAIQAPLIRDLAKMFCPTAVDSMDPGVVNRIACETEETIMERDSILHRLATLEKGALICRQYAKRPQHVLHLSTDEDDRSELPAAVSQATGRGHENVPGKLSSTSKYFPESFPKDKSFSEVFKHLSIPSRTSTLSPSNRKSSDLGQQKDRTPSPKPASAKPSVGLFSFPGSTATKISDSGTSSTTAVGGIFGIPVGTPIGGVPAAPSPNPAGGGNADTKALSSGLFITGSSGAEAKNASGSNPFASTSMEYQRKSHATPLFGAAESSTSMFDSKPSPAFGSSTEISTSNALPATSELFGGKSLARNDNSLGFPARTETTPTPRPRSTFGVTFHPTIQTHSNPPEILDQFQHICFMPGFRNFSCEEQRLEDYSLGLSPWWLKPPSKVDPVDFSKSLGNGK